MRMLALKRTFLHIYALFLYKKHCLHSGIMLFYEVYLTILFAACSSKTSNQNASLRNSFKMARLGTPAVIDPHYDMMLNDLVDIFNCIPAVLMMLMLVAVLGRGMTNLMSNHQLTMKKIYHGEHEVMHGEDREGYKKAERVSHFSVRCGLHRVDVLFQVCDNNFKERALGMGTDGVLYPDNNFNHTRRLLCSTNYSDSC